MLFAACRQPNGCVPLGVAAHAAGNQCSYKQGFGGSCVNDVTACKWSGLGVCMAAGLSQ